MLKTKGFYITLLFTKQDWKMTRHVLATFYEKSDTGFILGSDSIIGKRDYGEKYFKGANFIGLFMGTSNDQGDLDENKISEDKRDTFLKSLDGVFEDISVGKSYSHIPVLNGPKNYCLNIAVRKKNALEVYSVTNMKEPKRNQEKFILESNPHIAQQRYILEKGKKDIGSFVLLAGQSTFPFFNIYSLTPFNFEQARKVVIKKLQSGLDPNYYTGDLYLYIVSFNIIGPLEKVIV